MTGIVFRQVRSASERETASRLLADGGVPAPAADRPGGTVLFGLWDLAAPAGDGPVGAAATRPVDDAGTVELCGIVVRAGLRRRGLGRRLLAEVADALRADGAARLLARLESTNGPAAALLARAGFVATTDADKAAGTGTDGWCYLEL